MNTDDYKVIVNRLKDSDSEIRMSSINLLHNEIRDTAGTITTKQMKLFDIVEDLKGVAMNLLTNSEKQHLFDLISVLSTSAETDSTFNVLSYRLKGNITPLDDWGHQYVKQLIKGCLEVRNGNYESCDYTKLVEPITEFLFKRNCEVEALDFLTDISEISNDVVVDFIESSSGGFIVNRLDLISKYTDEHNFNRVYEYLDELNRFYVLDDVLFELNKENPSKYLVHLIKLRKFDKAIEYVESIKDRNLKKQCLYILARCNISYFCSDEDNKILNNTHILKYYHDTAKDLEIEESKKIDYILRGISKEKIDTTAITNGLIHMGFGRDPVFFQTPGDFSVKGDLLSLLNHSDKITTVKASVGLILAFDPETFLNKYQKEVYFEKDISILLGLALSSYRNVAICELLVPMLNEFLLSDNQEDVIIAIYALSHVYSGAININIDKGFMMENIFPLISHHTDDVVLMTIYFMGVLYMGDGNIDVLNTCIETFIDNSKSNSQFYYLALLGLGMFFYKQPQLCESSVMLNLDDTLLALALGFMYVGTGNTDIINKIMELSFGEDENPTREVIGMISITLVSLSDKLATNQIESVLKNFYQIKTVGVKNIIPLCLSLLYASNTKVEIIDFLEKTVNSKESNVTSMIALGIVGAGTNSSRIHKIINGHFNSFYKDYKTANALIYSQGLLSLGKGMLSLNPVAYDGNVIIDKSLIGLLSTIFLFIDEKDNFFKDYSYMLYSIAQAATPKYVVGLDSEIKVGLPVDTVGLSGNPNKISGVVIHNLPVLLNCNEKAEIMKDVLSDYIEDVLVLKE
ncbi:RPN1 [Hepatospora eriocheir]|uniref:RPN1 n=1 Tax=Hepatospora eriocheir TaxID=1081669 RepID=A0A1X0QCV7_9MICR|nr:RPN1 [Hepatospora eriocheir]